MTSYNKKSNKYYQKIMLNLNIIKVLSISLIVVNNFISFVQGKFALSIFTIILALGYLKGLAGAYGYFNQSTPIVWLFVTRVLQIGWVIIRYKNNLIVPVLITLVMADLLFIFLLLYDKGKHFYN